MSWQSYVDDHLIATGTVSQAAICDLEGNMWAQSPGFAPSPSEVATIVKGFSNVALLQSGGITCAGVKYMYIRSDEKEVFGRKGASAVGAALCNSCVLIGTCAENIQPGQFTTTLFKLADYLRDSGM